MEEDLSSYHIGFLDCVQEKRIGREAGEQAEPGTSTRWQSGGIQSPNYDIIAKIPWSSIPACKPISFTAGYPFGLMAFPPKTPAVQPSSVG